MLVLSRHPNETIQIGDNITVKVVRIQGNVVKLAFEAPKDVKIMRQEVLDRDRQRAANVQIQSTPLSVLNVDDSAELSLDDVLPADDGPMCHAPLSAFCKKNLQVECLS